MTTQEIVCKVEAIQRNRYTVIQRFTLQRQRWERILGQSAPGRQMLRSRNALLGFSVPRRHDVRETIRQPS